MKGVKVMFEVGAVTILLIIVICILVLMLWVLSCGFSFYVGANLTKEKKKPPATENLTPQEKAKKEKEARELKNLMEYTGDAQ